MIPEIENTIIGAIYDASLDASLWPEVIGQIVDYTRSKTAILTAMDQLNPNYDFLHTWNISQAGVDAYQKEQMKLMDMKFHLPMWTHVALGEAIQQDLSSYAALLNHDEAIFYEQCLKVTGICYIAGVLLDQGEYRWAVLGVHRSPEEPAFRQEELDFLQRIGVHIRRALQIHKQLCFARAEHQNLFKMLDIIKVGIVLVDDCRRFYYANQRAQQMLKYSKIFEFDAQNKIYPAKQFQKKFDQMVHTAKMDANTQYQDIGGVIALENEQGQQFMVTVIPFSSVNALAHLTDQNQNYVVLAISDIEQRYTLATSFLKERYGLSVRECSICEMFVNGWNLEKIALQSSLSINSVRTYVKNIYAKMQCNSQAELLYRLMGMTICFEHIY